MNWMSLLFVLFAAAQPAEQTTCAQVQKALNDAIARERLAIVRYEAFAAKAEAEGYAGVAKLFHAGASSEAIHLRRFSTLMKERGLPLPAEEALHVEAGPTAKNLDDAIFAELAERDGAYREAIETCTVNRDSNALKVFDQTRDAEVEHANLCKDAVNHLEQMKTSDKEYLVCSHCGYTTDLRLGFCPLCRQTMR